MSTIFKTLSLIICFQAPVAYACNDLGLLEVKVSELSRPDLEVHAQQLADSCRILINDVANIKAQHEVDNNQVKQYLAEEVSLRTKISYIALTAVTMSLTIAIAALNQHQTK